MTYQTIMYEKTDMTCVLTLNRPESCNAINRQMIQEIAAACEDIICDSEIKVVIITGAGTKIFSHGTDPEEIKAGNSRYGIPLSLTSAISLLTCPVIAAINGDALGQGLELALACDIRISAENAVLGLPQIKSGLIPCDGGTQLLTRVVGKAKATELILTGESICAQEAWEIGLINKIVPTIDLMPSVKTLGKTIAMQSPLALRHAKEAILKGLDMTLEQGLRLEGDLYFLLHTTEDRTEGIRAFLEKRTPQFKGK